MIPSVHVPSRARQPSGQPSAAAAGMDTWSKPGQLRYTKHGRWTTEDSEKYGRCVHGDPLRTKGPDPRPLPCHDCDTACPGA